MNKVILHYFITHYFVTPYYGPEESETVVPEDAVTLGTTTKLVCTLSKKGKHMVEVEVVKMKFDDAGPGYDDSHLTSSEEIITLGGSVGWLKRTFSKQKCNMDDVAELKGGGIVLKNPSEDSSQSESGV